MLNIIIDEEFKALLPALDKDTYAMLEENLIRNGCGDSIVLWDNVLIDGHNRYEICRKRQIPFSTVNKDFTSREEALIWIISTQVSRRNLSPIQLSHFRGLHYMADKKMFAGNQNARKKTNGQNDHLNYDQSGSTANRLAKKYRVSSKTIMRDAMTATAIETIGEISPPAKKMILSGEVGFDKGKLGSLPGRPRKEIEAVAASIENGTYEKQKNAPAQPPNSGRPADSILAEIHSLQLSINKLTDLFPALPKNRNGADRDELKTELRSCIDQLENLYRYIP